MFVAVFIIGLILVILGLVELVRMLVFFSMSGCGSMAVIVKPSSGSDCEYEVRSAAERMRWLELNRESKLICINEKDDLEIDSICEKLKGSYPYLTVSNFEDLGYNIKSI